jgi:hypothetical protein
VVPHLPRGLLLKVLDRIKPIPGQPLIAYRSIELLNVGILLGISLLDVVYLNAAPKS